MSQPIRDLLDHYPAASEVFIRYRLACIGCDFSGFHTPADAASIYQLYYGTFHRDLLNLIIGPDRE